MKLHSSGRFSSKRNIRFVIAGLLLLLVLALFLVTQIPWEHGKSAPEGGAKSVSHSLNLVPHASSPSGASPQPSNMPTSQPHSGILHAQGAQLIDGSGHPFIFRGAQIASSLNLIASWQAGQDPAIWLNAGVFRAIASWHMNVLRLPVSTWYYTQANFLTKLDTIISQANQAGLYVVIAAFDNAKSGSPYGSNADVPKTENIQFWRDIASRYANNPMVLFDILNEPSNLTAQNYLYGGGSVTGSTGKVANIIGLQPLVDAIRSTGAKQIIIADAGIPAANPSIRIHDPNVMYTIHIYEGIGAGSPSIWDQGWGSLLGNYPLYYGEWAVLPNSLIPGQCQSYTPANADSDTNTFLQYMQSRNISWTAWEFRTYYLIQDYTNFTPTTFQGSWVPCDSNGQEGMGADVKNYLASAPSS
ncbi:MAG TPA: cellulase family glycosylhydrolase [Ktedonobacteraceae bacterium]|nr:cellulase family glycosylhydrolase [Ktedonobacteraceae bacterium]